jgi:hypothetical protein
MQANTGLALGPSLRSKNSTNQPPKAGGFFISLEEPTCKTKKTISDRTGEKTMTKNEIVKTIRSFAKDNGRNPSIRDITYKTKVTRHFIYEQFGSWRKALAGAGLKAGGPGMAQPESALMLDWAAATRKLGKIPSVYEYERAGRFSNVPFQTRYRRWKDVPEAFAKFARKDGVDQEWWVHRIQTEFPDCEAMRRVARGQWQRVRIEFEFESRNFLKHGHNPKGCDVIVCWVDNWPERPKNLQVIELRNILKNL